MGDLQINFGKERSGARTTGTGGMVFLIIFATPFVLLGLATLVKGVWQLAAGDSATGWKYAGIGLLFALVGGGLMFGAIRGRKNSIREAELHKRNPDKPWMWREDWAQGKIESSLMGRTLGKLFAGAMAFGLGMAGTMAIVPGELREKNYAALFILLFPVAGVVLVISSIADLRSRMRYGRCFFELAQVPIPVGGALEGMIETGTRFKLEHGLHLKLTCVRRVVTRHQKRTDVSEYVLWSDEKNFQSRAELPEPEAGHTGIPVHFKVPADQPECYQRGNESVYWRLQATAKVAGPDFTATFDLPVFRVEGMAAVEDNEPDPTADLQTPEGGEIRRDPLSRIRVTDGPGGREFYFPPARNLGACLIATLALAVWTTILVVAWQHEAPKIFLIIWGLFNLLIAMGTFNGWFKSVRVTVNPTGVRRVNGYLFFSVPKQFAAGEVTKFESSAAAKSGPQTFNDIRLLRQSGGVGVIMATGIADAQDANWLAREMTRAMGRG